MTATTAVVADPVEPAEPTMRSAQQLAEEEGLTFEGTPGPGYSEGGDVYEPKAAFETRSTSRDGGTPLARPVVASLG
jgi:hypothetical protein